MRHRSLLTCLSYSAGVQSHGILRMVLAGMIPRPEHFAVIYANPGMEAKRSNAFAAWAKEECKREGIPFLQADSGNLFADLIDLKNTNKTRLDTPPMWTKGEDGSLGKLLQKCTAHYKIQPIRRAVRTELQRLFGVRTDRNTGLYDGIVEQWIGFTADEAKRVEGLTDAVGPKYVRFAYPLVGMGLTKADVIDVYMENDWPMPPRSMCNACPFHGLRSLKQMHDEAPEDWAQAVAVDEACRDLTQIGVNSPCYVNQTLIPLKQLAEMDFKLPDVIENDLAQCPSGVCFA